MLSLFGHAIQLPVHEQKILTTGGLLHDIGKMYIPHNILNKPGKLDSSEFEVMKSHVTQTIKCLEKNDDLPNGIVTFAIWPLWPGSTMKSWTAPDIRSGWKAPN